MITAIKRFLANHGIGCPLNALVYSTKEISRMRIYTPKYRPYTYKWGRKNIGKYAVVVSGVLVHKVFDAPREADSWARWNYKGLTKYKIIKIT